MEQFGIIIFLDNFKGREGNFKSCILCDKDNKKTKFFKYNKDISLVSISAQIIIFPIIAYINKTISFTFIISNILTSFLISIIIIFGFFLILISFPFFSLAKILGKIYKLPIDLLLYITEKIAQIPFSKIYIKTPFLFEIIIYYLIVFFLLYLNKKYSQNWIVLKLKQLIIKIKSNYKKLTALVIVISVVVTLIYITPKDFKIYFIDVRTR